MLLVVAFVACFAAREPATCEAIELPWEGSLRQCQMFGQMAIASWVRDHHGFATRGGYRCLPGRAI